MNETERTFLRMCGAHDYPLCIVTAATGRRREGCVVGFQTQCSFDPPRFLACISRANRTHRLAQTVAALAVHLVPADQEQLAELFGGETGDEIDKFSLCDWRAGPRGLPLLDRCPSWFCGAVCARYDLGDHEGFVLEPFAASYEPGELLYFQRVKDLQPGHPA